MKVVAYKHYNSNHNFNHKFTNYYVNLFEPIIFFVPINFRRNGLVYMDCPNRWILSSQNSWVHNNKLTQQIFSKLKPARTWENAVERHDPTFLQHAKNLWTICGYLYGGDFPRQMTVYKMQNGGLWIHSCIALKKGIVFSV